MKHLSLEKLADTVISKRKSLGLSQTALSEKTGINRTMFTRLENKDYTPSIDQLLALSEVLDFNCILSSTVLARDCAVADAYATAFMVLGLDSAKTVLAAHPELQAYFIYSDADGNNATWDNLR